MTDAPSPPDPLRADPSPEGGPPPFVIREPTHRTVPLIFASPHSGDHYPEDFVARSPLDPLVLRRSEDSFVDRLFAAAPDYGAPLIAATFPRAFLDPNREPFELDPSMFADTLPTYVNTRSSRVAAGLGTIPRIVSSGLEIYDRKLRFEEAHSRIEQYYRPYHRALQQLIDDTRDAFGYAVVIDCHSMPSIGGPKDPDAGRGRADIVLGDCFGSACDNAISRLVERTLHAEGYVVIRNKPFAGGYTTRHYGRPAEGCHVMQIEINRALYMDERRIEPNAGFGQVRDRMTRLIAALADANALGLAAE